MASNVRTDYAIGLKDETKAGFQSIEANLSRLKSSFSGAFAVLGGAGAAAGALAGLAGATARAIELGDKLKDMSTATGQSVEQLSFLNYAAQQSGTSIEAVSGLFSKFSSNLEKISQGKAPAATAALQTLGLSVKELQGLDLSSAISLIGTRLATVENPYKRAALGVDIFSKSYKDMAALILEGDTGLKQMFDRFIDLGGVLTKKQAGIFDDFNDALGEMKTRATAAGAAIGESLLPSITNLIRGITDLTTSKGLSGFFSDLSLGAGEAANKFAIFANAFDIKIASILGQKEKLNRALALEPKLQSLLADKGAARDKNLENIFVNDPEKLRKQIRDEQKGGADGFGDPAPKSSSKKDPNIALVLGFFKEAEKEKQKILKDTADVHNYLSDQMRKRDEEEQTAQAKFYQDRYALIQSLRTPTEQYADEVKRLLSYDLDSENLSRGLDRARESLTEAEKQAQKTNKTAEDLGLTFSSAFEDAIVSGKSFSEVLKGIGQDILRIMARNLITEPLAAGISSFFSSSVAGGFTQASALGGSASSFFGGFRASGGPVSPGRAYMVGEQGPEIFSPASGGTIIPNSRLGGSPPSETNVVINNYSGQPAQQRQTLDSRGNRKIEVTIGELVAREIRRTGSNASDAIRGSFGASPALVRR